MEIIGNKIVVQRVNPGKRYHEMSPSFAACSKPIRAPLSTLDEDIETYITQSTTTVWSSISSATSKEGKAFC